MSSFLASCQRASCWDCRGCAGSDQELPIVSCLSDSGKTPGKQKWGMCTTTLSGYFLRTSQFSVTPTMSCLFLKLYIWCFWKTSIPWSAHFLNKTFSIHRSSIAHQHAVWRTIFLYTSDSSCHHLTLPSFFTPSRNYSMIPQDQFFSIIP